MILLQGKGISEGVAHAPIYFLQNAITEIHKQMAASIETEKGRIRTALEETKTQLEALAQEARENIGEDAATLFETHAMFAEDEDYVGAIMTMLESEQCNAEFAIYTAGEQFANVLADTDDTYMQARATDIKDVTHRILNNLMRVADDKIDSAVPVILAADDLAPSETLQLDRSKILGFVTRNGSENSHTAILARTMGVPAICGLGTALQTKYAGCEACIDGETGKIILNPDAAAFAAFKAKEKQQAEKKGLLQDLKEMKDETLDGRELKVYCNIGSVQDVDAVLANGGSGIGLFRSEFLYLASKDYPTEDEQFRAYKAVASAMNGKRVIIRTLDIGADKQASYFQLPEEENPAMGLRAIRLCLNRKDVFRTQLRALYRASAYGKVSIMFPMITSVWEVRECKRMCAQVMAELDAEDIPYNGNTEIGIMIETPASVLVADALAKEVDFFSVGTNDLTQYTLACDRQSNELGKFYDSHHPAVLRELKMAADAAHAAGIWIGICGDLGADLSLLETFLAIGIDELSVPPSAVLPLRSKIRQSRFAVCSLDMLKC